MPETIVLTGLTLIGDRKTPMMRVPHHCRGAACTHTTEEHLLPVVTYLELLHGRVGRSGAEIPVVAYLDPVVGAGVTLEALGATVMVLSDFLCSDTPCRHREVLGDGLPPGSEPATAAVNAHRATVEQRLDEHAAELRGRGWNVVVPRETGALPEGTQPRYTGAHNVASLAADRDRTETVWDMELLGLSAPGWLDRLPVLVAHAQRLKRLIRN